MITRRMRDPHSDQGAMLLFALVIITVVALVTGALLTLSDGNFRATVGLRKVAATGYASDSAAKLAINALELGKNANDPGASYPADWTDADGTHQWVYDNNTLDGTGCFGLTGGAARSQISFPNVYVDSQSGISQTATVTCTPVVSTGIFGTGLGGSTSGGYSGGGSAGTGGTGRALTILGTSPTAIQVKPLGGSTFAVHGDIAIQGGLAITNGPMATNGTVSIATSNCSLTSGATLSWEDTSGARTGCPGASGGTVTDPHGSRSPDIAAVPSAMGSWSGCTFHPGYYDDAQALQSATDLCPTAIFAPGDYYFDFHNNAANDPTASAGGGKAVPATGTDMWTVNNALIGGQTTAITSYPGRCKSPVQYPFGTGQQGVQFIFGGDSHMTLGNNGSVELCAQANSTLAPIAIFGLDGTTNARGSLAPGYAGSANWTNAPTATAGTVTSSKSGSTNDWTTSSGTLQQALAATGGQAATFSSSGGTKTPNLTLSGFGTSGIPVGSMVQSATVFVTHNETATGSKAAITPSLAVTVGSTNVNTSWAASSTTKTDQADITQALAADVHNGGNLGDLSMVFTEAATGNTTASVDAVTVVIKYLPPMLRGETSTAITGNCVATLVCDVVATGGGSSWKGNFIINGVTYIPTDSITFSLGNGSGTGSLAWGLVAKQAVLLSYNTYAFGYPFVSIPDSGPGLGSALVAVDLKVYLCPGAGSSCPTTGSPALTSRVEIIDPISTTTGLINPNPGTRQINVLSWAEQK